MGRIVKCAYCGHNMDKDVAVRYKEKNYHDKCCQAAKERDRVCKYICYIYNLKVPGPRNYALLKKYIEEGYTYKGIFYSLKYFYEIQKADKAKAKESIGIVPFIYEEAQKYFEELENKQAKVKTVVSQIDAADKLNVTVSTKINKPKSRKEYNLDDLLGD